MDLLFDLILLPAHAWFVPIFIVLGFFVLDKKIMINVTLLVMFTITYNLWLKNIFQLPLPAGVNDGAYALPSSHTHQALVFWGYLAIAYRYDLLKIVASIWGLFYAHSLVVVHHYHWPVDVLSAILFGAITLFIFNRVSTSRWGKKNELWIGPIMCGLNLVMLVTFLDDKQFMHALVWTSLFAIFVVLRFVFDSQRLGERQNHIGDRSVTQIID